MDILRDPIKPTVISNHLLDHIGVEADGQINNGADDDGSGTVAMMEIAEAFIMAKEDGNGPGVRFYFYVLPRKKDLRVQNIIQIIPSIR